MEGKCNFSKTRTKLAQISTLATQKDGLSSLESCLGELKTKTKKTAGHSDISLNRTPLSAIKPQGSNHNVLPTLLNGALDHIPATMCSPLSSMEHWTTYLPQCAPHSPQWSTGPHTCHNVLPTLLNAALDHGIRLGQTLQPFHQFGEVSWVLGLHCHTHHRRHTELHGLEVRGEREDQMIGGEGGSNDRRRRGKFVLHWVPSDKCLDTRHANSCRKCAVIKHDRPSQKGRTHTHQRSRVTFSLVICCHH